MTRFCTHCGKPLQPEAHFCTSCGGTVPSAGESSSVVTPAPPLSNRAGSQNAPSEFPPSTPLTDAGQPPRRGSLLPKLIVIALVLILLVGAAIVGGVMYVGNKVRQKARALAQSSHRTADDKSAQPDSTGALQDFFNTLSASGAADDDKPADGTMLSALDKVAPCTPSPMPTQDKSRIPFKRGTVFTGAWGVKYGDAEVRRSVDLIDDATVTTTTAIQEHQGDSGKTVQKVTVTNETCNSDYQSAKGFMTVVNTSIPRLMHEVTRLRLSDKLFQEIKSNGKVDLQYDDISYVAKGIKHTREGGVLTRVEPQDVPYPMIVNDQRVDLPAIHLSGTTTLENDSQSTTPSECEIFVLDDPGDPVVLNFRLKNPKYHDGNFRVETVKINFPVANPENVLEKQLTQDKRAVTYGIYFDFNKDTLKPESEPVLKQIVQAMTDNPDWKLTVEGHTDNIGGDSYNVDLSKRRAESVKQALVSRYDIAPGRLLTGGFGASSPVATNDTLEGRARNRRVELVRE
jgi:outer membrane protein OmpA-like peptidoglycan-associated protein